MRKITSRYDLCTDSTGPATILAPPPIRQAYHDLHKRGVKIRVITEVIASNISRVNELMTIAQVRHLDGSIGNFVIADGTDYTGAPESENGYLKKLVASNIGSFVKLQQYFFDMLWDKAIPANQRIKEIIEGRQPDQLEVIHDTQRSIGRAFEIMNETKKEFLVLFANSKAFILAMGTTEAADLYRKMLVRGATVRVLVPTGEGVQDAMKKGEGYSPRDRL
jgi:two-component system, OmpR family, sensor histidine kinase VicK